MKRIDPGQEQVEISLLMHRVGRLMSLFGFGNFPNPGQVLDDTQELHPQARQK